MAKIYTVSGDEVIVDDEDYERLSSIRLRKSGNGYVVCRVEGKIYPLARLLMNPPPGMVVDHINGNRRDNRKCNLRICTAADNARNRPPSGGESGYAGVFRYKTKKGWRWRAHVWFYGRKKSRGGFKSLREAVRARDELARQYWGEFARMQFNDSL